MECVLCVIYQKLQKTSLARLNPLKAAYRTDPGVNAAEYRFALTPGVS